MVYVSSWLSISGKARAMSMGLEELANAEAISCQFVRKAESLFKFSLAETGRDFKERRAESMLRSDELEARQSCLKRAP